MFAVAFPSGRAFTPGDRERLALLAEEGASMLSRRTVRDAEAGATAVGHANGGTLHVRSLPGTGCVFTIDLPAA